MIFYWQDSSVPCFLELQFFSTIERKQPGLPPVIGDQMASSRSLYQIIIYISWNYGILGTPPKTFAPQKTKQGLSENLV